MGGQCTESLWRGERFAIFAVNNTGKNPGETYKLSSDVGAYIFVVLKSPRAGFSLMRHFAESSNVEKPIFVVSTLPYDVF